MQIAEDIFVKLKAKDSDAFEQVFKQYYPELVGFANKYLQDMDLAEEMVQDLFCSFWDKVESLNIQTNLKSYLYSAVRNAAFNYFKHQKVVDKYQQHATLGDSYSPDSSMGVELKELQNKIDSSLELLPEKCKKVFELSRFHHKKYREIAEELGISIKTVEIHMGKALKILRRELGSYLPLALLIWDEIINKQ